MLKKIVATNWSLEPYEKHQAEPGDFIVHIYMGSSASDNIVLKPQAYEIEEFMSYLIRQIPRDRRTVKKLFLLFNIFLTDFNVPDYNADDWEPANKKKNADPYVKIYFDEYGTNANLDTRSFASKSINLLDLITKFREGLVFNDGLQMSEDDKKQIRLQIGQAVFDVLKGPNFDADQIVKPSEQFTITLNIPYEKNADGTYKTQPVLVEPKQYTRMKDFLSEIYNQLPKRMRNTQVFLETLKDVFDKTEFNRKCTGHIQRFKRHKQCCWCRRRVRR